MRGRPDLREAQAVRRFLCHEGFHGLGVGFLAVDVVIPMHDTQGQLL